MIPMKRNTRGGGKDSKAMPNLRHLAGAFVFCATAVLADSASFGEGGAQDVSDDTAGTVLIDVRTGELRNVAVGDWASRSTCIGVVAPSVVRHAKSVKVIINGVRQLDSTADVTCEKTDTKPDTPKQGTDEGAAEP